MTNSEKLLSIEDLKSLIRLDEKTGHLYWLPRAPDKFSETPTRSAAHSCANWNSLFANKRALASKDASGHCVGHIYAKPYYAHRVVFALSEGRWPSHSIDHINGGPADNRPLNLRDVLHKENLKNQKLRSSNTSGFNGVSYNNRLGKWMAHMTLNGKYKHLGFFFDKSLAIAARQLADSMHGFHKNHGEIRNAQNS